MMASCGEKYDISIDLSERQVYIDMRVRNV